MKLSFKKLAKAAINPAAAIRPAGKQLDSIERRGMRQGKVGRTLTQIGQATRHGLVEGVLKDPERLLTGAIDPIGTKISNTLTGRKDKALVNQVGGPTGRTLNKIGASKTTRGVFKVADTIATYYGTMGAAGGLSNLAGSAGIGNAGTAASRAANAAGQIPGPTTAELMAAGPQTGAGGVASGTGAVGSGAVDTALAPVQLAPNAVRVGTGNAMTNALTRGGGLIKSAMSDPYIAPAAIQVGGQLIGGAMADKADKDDRRRYNRNIGTELWPSAAGA